MVTAMPSETRKREQTPEWLSNMGAMVHLHAEQGVCSGVTAGTWKGKAWGFDSLSYKALKNSPQKQAIFVVVVVIV